MSTSEKDATSEKEKKRKRTLKVTNGAAGDAKLETKRIKVESGKAVESDVNMGRKLFYLEEEEVEGRKVDEDMQLFQSAYGDIQKTIMEIKQLKEAKGKNSKAEIEAKKVEGMLQILMLKKLNRLAHIRCKKVRDSTNEAKQRIDTCHLLVQNLLYEIMHLEKEITKCLEFKSKDEEIDLVPIDQFYNEAPEGISKPDVTKKDFHQQTLCRLDWELVQRKQLAEKLKEAEKKRDTIESDIKSKQDDLESLQPKLNNILQATKPVQDCLNMPFDKTLEEHQVARYLPDPLYVLYMQTSAYGEACDSGLKVKLEGDMNAAKSTDINAPFILEEDSDSDQEEQEHKKTSKRRRKTVEVKTSENKLKFLTRHPLSVQVDIHCKDGSVLGLKFQYLIYLKIVTVTVTVIVGSDLSTSCLSGSDLLSPDSLLDDLYPGDHGDNSPNHSNQYELARYGLKDFSYYLPQIGRPYQWVQWLAGMQYLSGEAQKPTSSVSASSMQNTILKLRKRIRSRLTLLKQLHSLEKKHIPVSSEFQHLFPVKISSQLTSWQRSTYEEFVETSYTQALVQAGFVRESDLFFTASVERGQAKMTARIVLAPNYPAVSPVFCINIQWHNNRNAANDIHVQELEEELNVHYEELTNEKSQDLLLTNQLQRLLMCFDVYLETESGKTKGKTPEFPLEKLILRTKRGPQRSKPYKFCPDSGMFDHR